MLVLWQVAENFMEEIAESIHVSFLSHLFVIFSSLSLPNTYEYDMSFYLTSVLDVWCFSFVFLHNASNQHSIIA